MIRMGAVIVVAGLVTMLSAAPASADTIGSAGIGDPYYPLDGNGGYDVGHYDIRLSYQPAADELCCGPPRCGSTTRRRASSPAPTASWL